MRSVASTLLALLVVLASTPALAGGPPGLVQPEEPPPAPRVVRYGTQVFLADLAWIGGAALVGKLESSSDGEGGLSSILGLGYFVAAPMVHAAKGNSSGAWKSLGARTLMPIGGAVIGMAIVASGDDDSEGDDGLAMLGGMVLGAGAGMVTAAILDYTVFAKKTVEAPRYGYLAKAKVRPGVKISKQGFAVSLGGSF
jgi:hypothetical protein